MMRPLSELAFNEEPRGEGPRSARVRDADLGFGHSLSHEADGIVACDPEAVAVVIVGERPGGHLGPLGATSVGVDPDEL